MIFRQVQKTVEAVETPKPSHVADTVRGAVENGSFVISEAVLAGLRERGLSHGDVRNALAHATSLEPSPTDVDRWTIRGPSMDGEEIAMTVAVEGGVVMVI